MINATATCQWCSSAFTYQRRDPRGRARRWCSERCRLAQRDSERRPMCAAGCGQPAWIGKGSRDDAMCRPCRTKAQRLAAGLSEAGQRECSWCGVMFRPVKCKPGPQYCPDPVCRVAFRGVPLSSPWSSALSPVENARVADSLKGRRNPRNEKYRAARKRLRSSLAPGKGDEAIFTRDRWKCHLCDLPVSRSLKWPRPMSPTIDHLVPQGLGGSDDPANLATAHRACNEYKGKRAMREQLRLVG